MKRTRRLWAGRVAKPCRGCGRRPHMDDAYPPAHARRTFHEEALRGLLRMRPGRARVFGRLLKERRALGQDDREGAGATPSRAMIRSITRIRCSSRCRRAKLQGETPVSYRV